MEAAVPGDQAPAVLEGRRVDQAVGGIAREGRGQLRGLTAMVGVSAAVRTARERSVSQARSGGPGAVASPAAMEPPGTIRSVGLEARDPRTLGNG